MNTTRSGSGRPEPTGELAAADSEIAGGSEPPAFVSVSSVDVAYAAGIFDGEGNVHIGLIREGDYRLQIQTVNTSRPLLEWLQARWGGGIYDVRHYDNNPKYAPCWTWNLSSRAVKYRFLAAIEPHLIIKRRAAKIALAFLAIPPATPPHRSSPDLLTRKAELFRELRGLPKTEKQGPAFDQLAMELEAVPLG